MLLNGHKAEDSRLSQPRTMPHSSFSRHEPRHGRRPGHLPKPLISFAYALIPYGSTMGYRASIGARRKVQSDQAMEIGASLLLPTEHPLAAAPRCRYASQRERGKREPCG